MKKFVVSLAMVLATTGALPQEAKFGTKPVMTRAIAKQLAAAILKAACKTTPPPGQRPVVKNGTEGDCIGAVAIADDTGTVIYLEVLDGTQIPSIQMSLEKARTAALWKRATDVFHEAIQTGKNMSYLDGSFPLTSAPGGEPLMLGNDCVGGLGFSGQEPKNVMPAAMAEWQKITGGK